MTSLSDAVVRHISKDVPESQVSQRANGTVDCSITFFDHVPEVDRQQVRDVVAALLAAKQAMTHDGAIEPSLIEVAKTLGIGRRLDIQR